MLETDETGSITARNVWGLQLIERETKDTTYNYLHDAHGDIIGLTDDMGNVIKSYIYDPYGNEKAPAPQGFGDNSTIELWQAETDGVDNPFRYSGQYLDDETGLYYLRARYYDPETQRFTQEDRYTGTIDNQLSLNLYIYCQNNPVMFVDPSGYILESDYTDFAGKDDVIAALEHLGELWEKASDEDKIKIHEEANKIRDAVRNGDPYHDKTAEINELLELNLEELNELLLTNDSINLGNYINTLLKWVSLVQAKGDWDYKTDSELKLPWFPEYGVCTYNGQYITLETLGNINYGYTGTYLSFSPKSIFTGAGWAAGADNSSSAPYYGDTELDHNNIQWGIDLYYKQHQNDTQRRLINIDVRPILDRYLK